MRPIVMLALGLGVAAPAAGIAQIKSDPGVIGPRAVPRAADRGNPDAAADSSIPAGEARADRAGHTLPAIPADQARATIASACGGPVSGVGVDSRSTWHATCQKGGRSLAVTLGTDGKVEMH